MNSFSECLHQNGADVISTLQNRIPNQGEFFMWISHIGDPGLAFTFYFPLMAALNATRGLKLLWTVLFCEWTNMILKWVLAGDRPYWWVHESALFKDGGLPTLQQFPLTCETGPGMPSGHSTLNAALFFVIVQSINQSDWLNSRKIVSLKQKQWIQTLLWGLYSIWLVLVILSRTYIAAHFPHQCITGTCIGVLSAIFVLNCEFFDRMNIRKSVLLTAFVIVSVLSVFASYTISGGDPMWSVSKAVRWCTDQSYINIDSKPFYSFSRFSGHTLGMGLAMSSKTFKSIHKLRFPAKTQIALVLLNLAAGHVVNLLHKSIPSSIAGYYLIEFMMNACLSYVIIAVLPYVVKVCGGSKKKQG